MEYVPYRNDLLPALVAYWNASFADRPNFFPITPEIFRARVVEKANQVERFNPEDLILAVESDGKAPTVRGMVHVGRRSEAFCRAAFPGWGGGEQGYVAFLHVRPESRGRGVGAKLWDLGLARLAGTVRTVLDTQCLNPFYGNSEGPATPFWGSPEGIGLLRDDEPTRRFFSRRGHLPRFEGFQFSADLAAADPGPPERTREALAANGLGLRTSSDLYPEVGARWGTQVRFSARTPFTVHALIEGEMVRGLICTYPLAEVGPGIHGIYETLLAEGWQGKGLGTVLVREAVRDLKARGGRRCDVLTIPGFTPAGLRLYAAAGFRRTASWSIY